MPELVDDLINVAGIDRNGRTFLFVWFMRANANNRLLVSVADEANYRLAVGGR
jgi:hypothetical protein